jgi:hypothetical protein
LVLAPEADGGEEDEPLDDEHDLDDEAPDAEAKSGVVAAPARWELDEPDVAADGGDAPAPADDDVAPSAADGGGALHPPDDFDDDDEGVG